MRWMLILLTPLFFLITHAIAYFFHEYCHSFSAWILGYKQNPLALHYGDASWANLLLLQQVSENVNYASFSTMHPWAAAFIAFTGFGIGNVLLFIISVIALYPKSKHSSLYYYFFLWLAVMNLGNFIDYVPSRTFATHGDMHEIVSALSISPWWLMTVFGYPICYSIWFFYSTALPHAYANLPSSLFFRSLLFILVTLTLFIFFGPAGINGYGDISHLISLLSIYTIPIVLLSCWPQRSWVREKISMTNRD